MQWTDINKKLIDKILELFPEKRASTVYHYTSLEVLWEFLKPNYDFLCTYCKALSDPTEFKKGMNACAKMWRKLCDGDSEKFLLPFQGAITLAGDCGLNCVPWTMSFSTADDETSQWKNYTDNRKGGCAVGFSAEKIMQDIKRGLTQDDWCLISFLPCVYVGYDREDLVYKLFEYVMTDVVKDLVCMLSLGGNDDRDSNTAQTLAFLLLCSIVKHKDFREEREWRLILQPLDFTRVAKAVAMKGGKIRIETGVWCDKRKVSDCIERIIISPHGPSENLMEMGELFVALRELKKDERPIVVPSESPYRGALK